MNHTARLLGDEFAETARVNGTIMRRGYSKQTISRA
jgi:hypothetical protein